MTSPAFAPPAPPDPLLGAVLQGRYRVVRRLGAGGMGVVYEGEHVGIRRRVAIKCLHPTYAHNPELLARFHREALAATAIGNEHIIEVTDMGSLDDGTAFLVLEYLDGSDLGGVLKERGRIPVSRAVHIVSQVCEALAAAHAKGIVHRDVKPDNVFLIARGGDPDFVKLLDFGISKFHGAGEEGRELTDTGSMLGTPRYMAPEQFSNSKGVDARADVYSVGCIVFRALTGRPPFEGDTLQALLGAVLHAPLPDLRELRPDLPPELAAVVQRMLARSPDDRFLDCDAVRASLRPFAAFAEVPSHPNVTPATPGPAPPPATPAPRPHADAVERAAKPEAPPRAESTRSAAPLWPRALGLAIALVASAALIGRLSRRAPAPTPDVRAPATRLEAPPSPPPATPVRASSPPASVPAAHAVRIRIRATPADAELYLDSRRIMNPFDGELPAAPTPRRLEVRRAGFRTVVVPDLVLEFPQTMEVALARGGGEERRVARQSRNRRDGDPVLIATHAPTTPVASTNTPSAVVPPTAGEPARPNAIVPVPPQVQDPFR